jgi:hypothetical protein
MDQDKMQLLSNLIRVMVPLLATLRDRMPPLSSLLRVTELLPLMDLVKMDLEQHHNNPLNHTVHLITLETNKIWATRSLAKE